MPPGLVTTGRGNYPKASRYFWKNEILSFFFFKAVLRSGRTPDMFAVFSLTFAEHLSINLGH